jgi:Ca2+-binding EF-hand superfamily protein
MPALLPHHRPDERQELKRLFEAGVSAQMLAARRVGKTWLMKSVAADLLSEGWTCIHIDLEGMRTEEEFWRSLCREIEAKQELHTRVFSHFFQRFKQLKEGSASTASLTQIVTQLDPKLFSQTLVESLNSEGKKTLICVDEISLFVSERAEQDSAGTRALLYHLRSLRQSYPNVVWLLTGSIGLDVVTRRLGLQGALLDLQVFPLEPFTQDAAHSYIEELGRQKRLISPLQFEEDAFQHLVQELGWLSPYYLYHVSGLIRPSGATLQNGQRTVTKPDVEKAFSEILKPAYRPYYAAWEEHLDKNFPREQTERLRAILEVCCQSSEGEIEATFLARLSEQFPQTSRREWIDLLTSLANDGFLAKVGTRWAFRSGLLRRYWLEYVV